MTFLKFADVSIVATVRALKPSRKAAALPANTVQTRTVPSLQSVMDIPPAVAGVYEMMEKEIKTLRSRIYVLNKENAFGWRWRTMMEKGSGRYHTLLVWRIH